MFRTRLFIGILLLACGAQAASGSQQPALNSVRALEYAILPGGSLVIKLVFKNALKERPPVLVNYHPVTNIVLDFADTVSALGKDPVEVKQRELRSLQLVQAGSRTRLVIALAVPLVHEIELKGRELWITLRRPSAAASREPGGWFPERASGAPKHEVRGVAFQRVESGEGRIIVELTDPATPIEVRRQGKALIVDFPDSALPPQLEHRLDVRDFGTPIRAIETYRLGNTVRMKIEFERAGEYSAYQVSGRFAVAPQIGER